MRTVRMKYGISGGRGDGTDWPLAGGLIDVSDEEAASLVGGRLADYADGEVTVPDPGQDPDSMPPVSSPGSSDPGDYASQPILALRELCRERGLRIAGSKAELIERLTANDAA